MTEHGKIQRCTERRHRPREADEFCTLTPNHEGTCVFPTEAQHVRDVVAKLKANGIPADATFGPREHQGKVGVWIPIQFADVVAARLSALVALEAAPKEEILARGTSTIAAEAIAENFADVAGLGKHVRAEAKTRARPRHARRARSGR